MENKTNTNLKQGFEVYLEGLKIPFNSLSVTETVGEFPNLQLTLPASVKFLNILPKTIVQVFGPDPITEKQVLIFEGEITSYNLSKTTSGLILTLACRSMLASWTDSYIKPLDAAISSNYAVKIGALDETNIFVNNLKERATALIKANTVETKQTTGAEKTTVENANASDTGFLTEIFQLLQDPQVQKGDFQVIYNELLNLFLKKDLFYAIHAYSYKFNFTHYVLPNFGASPVIVKNYVMANFEKFKAVVQNALKEKSSLKLYQALIEITQAIFYNLHFFGTPTASTSYALKSNIKVPLRSAALPDLKHAPPILTNVFFWDQVYSYSLSRNLLNEPTRTLGTYSLALKTELENFNSFKPWAVYPHIVEEINAKKNSLPFTLEESFRGIKVNQSVFSFFLTKALNEEINQDSSSKSQSDPELAEKLKPLNTALQQWTIKSHFDAKYSNRFFSFSTDWNPHRLIGFPAVFIDENNLALTGIISSISTQISANGFASSNITFANTRILDLNELNLSPQTQKEAHEVVLDSLDGYPDINTFLYNSDIYSFNNIGKEMYPLFVLGEFSKDSQLAQKLGKDFWEYWENNYKKPDQNHGDLSILQYYVVDKNIENLNIPHVKNTLKLKNAILNLKSNYIKNKDFILGGFNRNLIEKNEYFLFLGIQNNLPDNFIYSKNMLGTLDTETFEQTKNYIQKNKPKPINLNLGEQLAKSNNITTLEAAQDFYAKTSLAFRRELNEFNSVYDQVKKNNPRFVELRVFESLDLNIKNQSLENPEQVFNDLSVNINRIPPTTQIIQPGAFEIPLNLPSTFNIINSLKEPYIELYNTYSQFSVADQILKFFLKSENNSELKLDQPFSVEKKQSLNAMNLETELEKPYILTRRISVEKAFKSLTSINESQFDSANTDSLDTEKSLNNLKVNLIKRNV